MAGSEGSCVNPWREGVLTSVLEQFEHQARSQPHAIAVSFADHRMTYARLNERANRIAGALREAGVVSETLVALYLERSPGLIASLLGVWKAGAAYLPIDPASPKQRFSFTLEDSQVQYILTERSLLSSLPTTAAKVVCVEDLDDLDPGSAGIGASSAFTQAQPSPSQLAYVIYTSGSTGRPKGVRISHGGLSNIIASIGRDVALKPSDLGLASATIAFDISNEEIFLPLVAGASVHLMEREFMGDGQKLMEVLHRSGISLCFGTPTLWRLVIEAGWQGDPNLQIIVGGEVLPLPLARTLAGMTRSLWNHYGPTEASICATRELVLPSAEIVTLGQPIDNTQIYILDEHLQSVATGDLGEIYIAGAGVGVGYLHRPEQTTRAFLPDPFSMQPGARMYRTGDLGCFRPDGRLEFRGRADNQIKLRGFRIELEEIEAAIREYHGVHAAVVQLIEYDPDDRRLVAFFLSQDSVTSADLRDFLRQRLPFYMLPSEWVPLESLPMTQNGKVDHEALYAVRIEFEKRCPALSDMPPVGELEAGLTAIWQKLLKISYVSATDDFFALGGHSLLAARMFGEIEKFTGRTVPLSVLVQNPTIRQLAAYLHGLSQVGWPGLVPIQEGGEKPPLFIAHGLGSNLLMFRELAEELGPGQPVYGIQFAALPSARFDELRMESFASRYVEEICALDPEGPYYLAGHSLGGLLAFEIAAQLRGRGKEIGLLTLLDCDFYIAQRAHRAASTPSIPRRDLTAFLKKKRDRFLADGWRNVIARKFHHNRLMFKIWMVRYLLGEGAYFPNSLGIDPYIALFAEKYQPKPIEQDAVLFVATEQSAPELASYGWSSVIKGQLDIEHIPGSHHTILIHPQVSTLAELLGRRLARSAQSSQRDPASGSSSNSPTSRQKSLFECHGD